MARLWFLGEALIDFVPVDSGEGAAFVPRCGGSPLNAAIAAARAGGDVAFIGAISNDMFGDQLIAGLAAEGVDTALTPRSPLPTTLAFVALQDGEPRYAFFNTRTATSEMAPDAAGFDPGPGDILDIGSISLVDAPGGGNIARFAEEVAGRVTLALDPNARPGMTPEPDVWRARIGKLADLAAVVKLSREDLAFLAPGLSPDSFAEAQLARGSALVVVTAGAAGATAYCAHGKVSLAGHRVDVADTVGSGDTVTGTLLAQLAVQDCTTPAALAALTPERLAPLLERAMAAAALNCTAVGCAPPTVREVDAFLAQTRAPA